MQRVPVLVYHDIAPGRPPLSVAPALFEEHLDCLVDSGVTTLTASDLARALLNDRLPARAVCLTFDDGFVSAADDAAPRLLERGLSATVFCVAGYLGRTNDWPSQPRWVQRRPLAPAERLRELAAAGLEIGAHGFDHVALAHAGATAVRHEIVDARDALEQAVGARVPVFAYPYGSLPAGERRRLVAETYEAAFAAGARLARAGDDPLALPRVDAHYLRRTEILRKVVLGGGGPYLAVRRAASAGRRLVARDAR